MANYRQHFKGKFRSYVVTSSQVVPLLREAIRCIERLNAQDKQTFKLAALAKLQIELSIPILRLLRFGYIATSHVLLRSVQEVAGKIQIFYHYPELCDHTEIKPREVREKLKGKGYPDWKSYYDLLCDVSHQNEKFLKIYEDIEPSANPSAITEAIVEDCLATLNLMQTKTLGVLYDFLAPRIGSDSSILEQKFRPIEAKVIADYKALDKVTSSLKQINELKVRT